MKVVNVNIWDDYCHRKLETDIRVESIKITNSQEKIILKKAMVRIRRLIPKKVKLKLNFLKNGKSRFWQIQVTGLTHKLRENLIKKLNSMKPMIVGKQEVSFISES